DEDRLCVAQAREGECRQIRQVVALIVVEVGKVAESLADLGPRAAWCAVPGRRMPVRWHARPCSRGRVTWISVGSRATPDRHCGPSSTWHGRVVPNAASPERVDHATSHPRTGLNENTMRQGPPVLRDQNPGV